MDDIHSIVKSLSSEANLKKRKAQIDSLDNELKQKYPKLFEILSEQKQFDFERFNALCDIRKKMKNMDDKASHIEAGNVIFKK